MFYFLGLYGARPDLSTVHRYRDTRRNRPLRRVIFRKTNVGITDERYVGVRNLFWNIAATTSESVDHPGEMPRAAPLEPILHYRSVRGEPGTYVTSPPGATLARL
jgi:hypothetical protein